MLTLAFFIAYASSTLAYIYNPTGSGGGGGSGTVTSITATTPLTGGVITNAGSIGCQTASGSQAGCLSSADWTTFNGKGNGTVTSVALSGGATGLTITGSPITTSGAFQIGGILARTVGGTGTIMGTDPVFNRLWGWDVTDGKIAYIAYGDGLTYDHATHTLSSTTPLNQVTGALAAGAAQDSFNNKIDWEWNSLGNNTGLALSSTGSQALTGNTLFSSIISGPNTAGNVESVAGRFSDTHTGSNASNVGIRVTASGGSSNTAIDVTAGNINQLGGNIATSGTLTIGNSTTVTAGGVSIRLPTTNSGSTNKFVQTDGTGNWEYANAPGSPSSGSAGDVQLADGSGAFSGSGNFNYNNGSQTLTVSGQTILTNTSSNALSINSDAAAAITFVGNALGGLALTEGGLGNGEEGMYSLTTGAFVDSYTFRDDISFGEQAYFFGARSVAYTPDDNILHLMSSNTGTLQIGTITSYDLNGQVLRLGAVGLGQAAYFQNASDADTNIFRIFDEAQGSNIENIDSTNRLILFDQDAIGYDFGIGLDNPMSTFEVGGSVGFAWASTSSSATLDESATGWEYTGGGGDQFNLPAIATTHNRHYVIKNKSAFNLTLAAQSGEFIYTTTQVASITLAPGDSVTVDNDRTDWLMN